jgi:hypothetical protein
LTWSLAVVREISREAQMRGRHVEGVLDMDGMQGHPERHRPLRGDRNVALKARYTGCETIAPSPDERLFGRVVE